MDQLVHIELITPGVVTLNVLISTDLMFGLQIDEELRIAWL